ncbi:hypothetical protein NDU88_006662 [Pleurodeles waltl]|uniref:Uncharacterized protein n=1 Tax=Pleurodeles waltl TaxID=8319 RepID=A0AAV7MCW2_PLEWA|nr:hypothetical protein NDU88_006662 [Pleurodeles waltl]
MRRCPSRLCQAGVKDLSSLVLASAPRLDTAMGSSCFWQAAPCLPEVSIEEAAPPWPGPRVGLLKGAVPSAASARRWGRGRGPDAAAAGRGRVG